MCTNQLLKQKKNIKSYLIYLIAIIFAIFSGLSGISLLENIGTVISDICIKIFKCISLPIIALSIIVTLSQYNSDKSMQKMWYRTVVYTISTTIIAASISCILYILIRPSNMGNIISDIPSLHHITEGNQYLRYLTNLIPTNIFSPFLEHQVIGVLLVGIVVGIAIRHIPEEESRNIMVNFFKAAHGIFIVITGWVVKIIPIIIYGFITTTIIQLKGGADIKGLGEYLAIIILANLIQGFIILPLWLYINHIKPFKTMHDMLPALSIAFFSKSSTGTLPVTIKYAEAKLGINPKITRFILPLCTTINMNGCAAFIFTTVLYLMQNHGIAISYYDMAIWILIATIAAVGNAGVPMGCFFLSASLLTSMNIPITLLGIILPFYTIIDMIETALNVWSDTCVAKVVSSKETMVTNQQ